jgi:transposase, IS30 family
MRKERDLVKCLARDRKRRRLRTRSHRHRSLRIPHRTSIKERPQEINERRQAGRWEADTIISRRSKPALGIVLGRASRRIHLAKLSAKAPRPFRAAINRRLGRYPEEPRLSIAYANGCENVAREHTNKALGTR